MMVLSAPVWAETLEPIAQIGQSPEAQILIAEYNKILEIAQTSQPDGTVDGFTNYKVIGDGVKFLWYLGETRGQTTLKIYKSKDEQAGEDDFSVSYHYIMHRDPGEIEPTPILRRFIGPMKGWRNDSVDLETGYYLLHQGSPTLQLSERDKSILEAWGITQFGR